MRSRACFVVALLFGTSASCDRPSNSTPAPDAPSSSATPSTASAAPSASTRPAGTRRDGAGEGDGSGSGEGKGDASGSGRRKGRKREPFVYLDGKPMAVLRYSELPPGFEPTMVSRGNSRPFPIFSIAGYLERLGADLSKLKEVHLIGGSRVAVISGKELVRVKDKLHFAFQRATSGKARMDYPGERIEMSTRIDRIQAIYAFQEKEPARYDRGKRSYVDESGKKIEGVPYAGDASPEGTRVYEDGRMLAAIRRRDLSSSIADAAGNYSLSGYLRELGVDAAKVRGVDFIGDDKLATRIDAAGWKKHGASLAFEVPDQSRGRVRMKLPDAEPVDLSAISVSTK